jgi:ligand-binding sensor domain-containing protein/two-component sensor histidine kinase
MAYGPEAKYFSNLNYSVYQSKNGYLWFGTSSGLVRFDGKRYKNYFSDYTNPNSPSDNTIFDIAEDKNHDLWFAGFEHGVTKYNQHTGRFTKYPALSKDNNPYYGIRRIMNDAEGNLWFATAGRGLATYDFEKDTFNFYYPNPDKPKDGTTNNYNQVTDIAEDKTYKNILWVGTQDGLFSFDKGNKKFTFYSSGSITLVFPPFMGINDIEPGTNGLLWLGTYGNGLHCFDTETKKYLTKNAKKFAPIVYDLKLVNDSILYAACLDSGLYQLNINSGLSANISPPRNTADSTVKSTSMQKVSVTPDAGVFISGNYYVYQQHPDYVRLKNTINYPDPDKGKTNIALTSCVWDEKRKQYWLATDNYSGLYTLDKDLLALKPVSFEHTASETNRYFYGLSIDALNRVWVLQYYYGIYLWDETKKAFIKPIDVIPLPDPVIKKIRHIKEDKQGNIWMFSGQDFVYWHILENKIEIFPLTWDTAFKGSHDIRRSELKVDPDGNAWLLTSSGMFHCIRQQKKVNHIFKTGKTINDLSSSIVLTGAFNKYNDLWITSGSGIQVINRNDYSVLANHDINWELPSMQVRSINTDSLGRIWAGTTAGLGLFNPKNKTWRLFNRFDGMQRDYIDNFVTITANNKIVFDQENSILIRDINELVPDSKPPILHITSIIINNKNYQDSILPEFINELVLPHDQNNIDIEFAAMDWVYPFKTYYYYSIEGVPSKKSLTVTQDCKISLVGLQPGKYVLHIKALSGNGVFSKEIIFPITIKPPFWKTWWFISICILVLASLLYALYRYRINRIFEMQNLRNNISQDLHDDIGASLSSINILNELARRNIGQPEKSKEYLSRSSEDIQRISESLSDIVWNINPRYDDLQNLFIRMKRYAADMLDGKNINGQFDFPANEPGFTLSMTQRRDLYLIFKEAVNNLAKYSQAKNAVIRVTANAHEIGLLVMDDGKGFDPSNTKTGNGLQNMEQRAKASGAEVNITSKPGEGTTVKLEMRIS